jgi:hypothetical protein
MLTGVISFASCLFFSAAVALIWLPNAKAS